MSEALSQPQPRERELIDQQPLSVSARVAMQLGRESISSSVTAILELVKNAYDADATRVRIRFHRLDGKDARLVIEDDGRGMTLNQLRDNWMVIGTANKAIVRKTKKGRTPTGEKGLGRLGLDRLCSVTRVQSAAEDSAPVELEIDWSSYERATSRLEEVVHSIYTLGDIETDPITGERHTFPHGTRLILQGLKDGWSTEALTELRAELSLLVSPFAAPNDFSIELETGRDNESLDGVVVLPGFVLDAATWKVDEDVISKAWWIQPAELPDLQKTLKFLISESKKLKNFAKFTLGNVSREKRTKKSDVCLRRTLETVFSAFREVVETDKKIRPEYPTTGDFLVDVTSLLYGVTGTPIEKAGANTRAIFGDFTSIYDIQRAVAKPSPT